MRTKGNLGAIIQEFRKIHPKENGQTEGTRGL